MNLSFPAQVLAGPAVCLALFADAAPAGGLGALPRYLELLADDDEAAEARKTALAALDVARRYAGAPGSDRPARQSGAWAFEDLRLSLVALAFTDDAGGAVALDGDAAYDDGLVVDPSSDAWWAAATAEDAAARRDDVRAGALDVLARLLDDHEANGLAMCEARVPTDGARSPLAPKFVLEVATRPPLFGPAAAAARDVARVMWATEGAAIVAVMHAVAPPPSDDGDAEAPDESAVGALAAALRSPDRSTTALSLFRGLRGKNVSVRELALRAPSATGSPLFEDVFRDHVAADGAAVADGLALLCARRRPKSSRETLQEPRREPLERQWLLLKKPVAPLKETRRRRLARRLRRGGPRAARRPGRRRDARGPLRRVGRLRGREADAGPRVPRVGPLPRPPRRRAEAGLDQGVAPRAVEAARRLRRVRARGPRLYSNETFAGEEHFH